MSTLEDLFNQGKSQLSCLPHPEMEAKILLCESVSISSEQFYRTPDLEVGQNQTDRFFRLIKKRLEGFPLAYLTGKKEFWSMMFGVNPGVLIPRPETELVVEKAVEHAPSAGIIADIGTGSGNIAVSLAQELPNGRVVATDISKEAIKTAQANAFALGWDSIEFYHGDMFAPLHTLKLENRCDLIVSNPPYVSEEEWANLDPQITQHEPKNALVAGQKGLACIKKLIDSAPRYLKSGGFLIFEFGAGQDQKIASHLGSCWGETSCHKDLFGVPRVMVAQKK